MNKLPTIVVWFSCGAASAVAAKKTIEKYGTTHNIRVVNNRVMEEDEDNRRFLKDVEQWLGVEIEQAYNPKFPDCSAVTVWEKRRYMEGVLGAPCTQQLKKEARYHWEQNNEHEFLVLGFTAEEEKRFNNFKLSERDNILPILIEDGITKGECFHILKEAGIELPRIYTLGYPNANCIGCVKASSPTYWNHVRKMHPKVFDHRAKQSRDIGCKLVRVKGKRIYLDELDPEAKGRKMKDMDFECGIFCKPEDISK